MSERDESTDTRRPWRDEWFGTLARMTVTGELALWSHVDTSNRLHYRVLEWVDFEPILRYQTDDPLEAEAELRRLADGRRLI